MPDPISADGLAKALYDEYQEELWASHKVEELAEELQFPSFFLLDRDVVHPAACALAQAAGQETTPHDMGEARHDFQDAVRCELGRERAMEQLIQEGVRFSPEGLEGLLEEIAAAVFAQGQADETLAEWTRKSSRSP